MTPEMKKAMQDWGIASHESNEAEQDFKNIKDQLTKQNLGYAKAQQKIEELNKQREKLKTRDKKLGTQIGVEQQKIHKIIETLESNQDYKMAYTRLIEARARKNDARNSVWRLIAKEAENDTTRR